MDEKRTVFYHHPCLDGSVAAWSAFQKWDDQATYVGLDHADFETIEKTILIQYGIKKYENEETVFEKLKTIMSEKDIQRNIDTLIATQVVRRIGPEVLQNNESHTELPDLPENLKSIIENL